MRSTSRGEQGASSASVCHPFPCSHSTTPFTSAPRVLLVPYSLSHAALPGPEGAGKNPQPITSTEHKKSKEAEVHLQTESLFCSYGVGWQFVGDLLRTGSDSLFYQCEPNGCRAEREGKRQQQFFSLRRCTFDHRKMHHLFLNRGTDLTVT